MASSDVIQPTPPTPIDPVIRITLPVSTKLTCENFLTWRSQIEQILDDFGLSRFLDSTVSPPDEKIISAGLSTPNPAFHAWHRQDRFLLGWLRTTITEDVLAQYVHCQSARALWSSLHQGNYYSFSCFFPYSWNEDEFKDAVNNLGPGVERFIFIDEKEINRVGVAVKQATVSYLNRQCAWYSFHRIGQPGFKFGHIEPSPFWIVTAERKQSYIEALGKDNCEPHVSQKHEQLLYACWTCGISESVTSLCKERHHFLMSKEDYAILNTNKTAKYSCFPIHGMNIKKGDFIINLDASCGNEIGFGVVIRTSTMEFFLNSIGGPYPKNNCTSYDAEALALEYAIRVGLTRTTKGKLFIFTDCLPVAICFKTGKNISCGNNVKVDRELVNRCRVTAGLVPWIEDGKLGSCSKPLVTKREVEIFHVHRELNQAADAVAKRATSRDSDFDDRTPIREIKSILKEDKFLYRVIKKKTLGANV